MIVRFSPENLRKRSQKAQFVLDSQIMTDMVPLMPHQTGGFIQLTRARSAAIAGTGSVCAGTGPQGRFLYEGKVMIGEISRSPFAMPGERKIRTNRNLVYNHASNPEAGSHWFERAKERHLGRWVQIAKDQFTM